MYFQFMFRKNSSKAKLLISQQLLKEIHKRSLFIKLSLNSNGLETNE